VIRGRDILSLPVITRDAGAKAGQVEDLLVDRQGSRIVGIVLSDKGMLSDARVVAWSAVIVIGLDAVIIDSEKSIVKASTVPEIEEILDRDFVLQGSKVETTAGRDLGRIENFFFDGTTGVVEGFELIGGVNDQQPSGRAFMPAHPSFESGKDYTFVSPEVAEDIVDLTAALKARSR
jgi:uncharacterized protein YrrD